MPNPIKHKGTEKQRSARRQHALRRFKAIAYSVLANKFWLIDVEEDEALGEDVKKNVALLLKKKKDSILTKHDKSILLKRSEYRTEEEKIHINRIIGGLPCFRKYPPEVQMELAAATYFQYFPPNRVIVKQNREGLALYFIMTGEVNVSITTFDPILNEMITIVVGTMVAGQMFGEVSLLHNIPRTATITTTTDCELLCLMKDDFNSILKSSLQAAWDKVLYSLKRFKYFDFYDDVAKRECCIYSSIKTYKQDQIVYGLSQSSFNNVFFVLKGQCKMIEKLPVVMFKKGGSNQYRLFDRELYKKQLEKDEKSACIIRRASMAESRRKSVMKEKLLQELDYRDKHLKRSESTMSLTSSGTIVKSDSKNLRRTSLGQPPYGMPPHADISRRRSSLTKPSHVRECPVNFSGILSTDPSTQSNSKLKAHSLNSKEAQKSITDCLKNSSKALFEYEGRGQESNSKSSHKEVINPEEQQRVRNITEIEQDLPEFPSFVQFIFMQVCLYNELSCFGLGENLKNRHIIACSPEVECLLIPRYWLLQRNKGNLWTRIAQTLNSLIPGTEELFQIFVQNRRWGNKNRKLIKSIVKKPPCNYHNNVPFSIRLNSDINYEVDY